MNNDFLTFNIKASSFILVRMHIQFGNRAVLRVYRENDDHCGVYYDENMKMHNDQQMIYLLYKVQ